MEVSRCFGELQLHPMEAVRTKEEPLLNFVGGDRRGAAYMFDEKDLRLNRLPFHRDVGYTVNIAKGAMLRMVDAPNTEGETLFADTAMAYDDLPEDMKVRLEGLEFRATLRMGPDEQTRPGAYWKSCRPATREEDPDGPEVQSTEAIKAQYPPVVHPVVLPHPESGRKCIYISPTYVDFFFGMTQAESDELLKYLADHMMQPKYVYKHHWAPNDALAYDNRRVLHAGMGSKIGEKRYATRTTLAGGILSGRFYSPADGGPLAA
jgi:taurine dioxygenase